MTLKKNKKTLLQLSWIEEFLPTDVLRKPMFGGFGYYWQNKMVLALFESHGDRTYKNKTYDFELWNGCLFPCEYENHKAVLKKFPYLVNHPILGKWFYLPADTEDFENLVMPLLKLIRSQSELLGTIPKQKVKKTVATKKNAPKAKTPIKIPARHFITPQIFSDEPIAQRLAQAKKISDLKNLGPATQKTFEKAGIKTVDQFVKLGWQKTLEKLVKVNPKNRHSLFAYALIGALKNIEWNGISEADKQEARAFTQSLKKKK